ncbi:uncharacterized protein LOC106150608 [Lingula anatina]|uniref:Uncharacterized protein LOC106150608 n=1 Tax=Lingula anatina TaxID=7574 RepID=A0A1S3GYP4_LINAN|nr:uncharacterized protein LOC106150608 [Lingula anatina]|eukprot:XP_013378995.1 uncharacterized protein LOC106150608 [Lingula anatina]
MSYSTFLPSTSNHSSPEEEGLETMPGHHLKHLFRIFVKPEVDAIYLWPTARILFPCKLFVEILGLLVHIIGMTALCFLKKPLKLYHLLLINMAASGFLILFVSFLNSVIVLWQQTTVSQTTPVAPRWHQFQCSDDVIADILRHVHLVPLFAISGLIINQHVAGTAQSMYQFVVNRTKIVSGIIGIYVYTVVIYSIFHIIYSNVYSYEDCFTRYNGPYIMASNWYLGTLSVLVAVIDCVLLFRLCRQSRKLLNARRPKNEKVIHVVQVAEFADLKSLHEFNITVACLFAVMAIFYSPSVIVFLVIGMVTSSGGRIDAYLVIAQTTGCFIAAITSVLVPLVCARRICDVQDGYISLWGELRSVLTREEHVPMAVESASADREIEETLC